MSIYKRFKAQAITLLVVLTVLALVVASLPPATQAQTAVCQVTYTNLNDWGSGFTANVVITNLGSTPVNGWTLTWSYAGNQTITNLWNGAYTQSGPAKTVTNLGYNANIPANGGTVEFGFNANYSGANPNPTSFALNGVACGGVGPTATATNTAPPVTSTNTPLPPTATNTPPGPTATATNTSLPPTNTPTVPTSGVCQVAYNIADQWNSGFTANVVITNNGSTAVNGWTLTWTHAAGQVVTSAWNATVNQSGSNVSASNPAGHWNGLIGANGGSVAFGLQGNHSGAVVVPTAFNLNGTACGGVGPTATPTQTPPGPTATNTPPGPTATNTPPGPSPTPPPPGTHVQNPFVGAQGYINPDYAAQVMQQANQTGGQLGARMALVSNYSTAVWMDRIAAIEGGNGAMGLVDHLNAALAQQSGNTPLTIMVVVYNLPNRDCAALASNGELLIAEDGLNRYKTEYIDPIAAILSNPAYSSLRIVTIVEVDSLPNLITNLSTPKCAEAQQTGAYVQGIQYAINQLHPIPNVYIYLDIAHSGWLGWDSNFGPSVQLYAQTVQGTNAGFNSIDGFITNSANYTPIIEPFLPDPNLSIGGQPIRSSNFYEWNPYFDELDFATALRNAFISAGFPTGIGMLIDTSRNGWGGPDRPTGASGSTVNAYVDSGRIDRRPHRGGWCNQAGAGIGARPQAAPAPGIDAYVWVKPPGESDGVSQPGIIDPNDPNKQFDGMCDPNAQSTYDPAYSTNALPNAPHAGRWFPQQFQMLVENAFPPLQ